MLIHGEVYFQNFTVLLETKIKVLKNDEHVAFFFKKEYFIQTDFDAGICVLYKTSVHVLSYIVNVIGD